MKQNVRVTLVLLVWTFLSVSTGYGQQGAGAKAGKQPAQGKREKWFDAMVRLRYGGSFVRGDSGRFREDMYMTDESTYGIDWFRFATRKPDARGLELTVEGRSVYDYDYQYYALLKKKHAFYVKFDAKAHRRYYDGSNEYFDAAAYGLGGQFAEMPDKNFFTDRRDFNLEVGLTPRDWPELIFGWHRWRRVGTEVLLRGSRARRSGLPDFRGLPAIAEVDGTSDTLYVEAAHTFADKYNVRVRQEWEEYRDSQYIVFPRYYDTPTPGTLQQFRTFRDEPGFHRWNTRVMFDSFLDEQTYVTANYMYDYIKNDSSRDSVRPNLPNPNHFVNTSVDNRRYANVWAMGLRRANVIKGLHASVGTRVELSDTSAESLGYAGGTTARSAKSNLRETRVGESMRVVYDALPRTTLSLDVDLEQRNLDWSELEDVQSYEIRDAGSPAFLSGAYQIMHQDQKYTLKAVHRFNSKVKATVKYRVTNLDRNYNNNQDNAPAFYPGFLGDYRRSGNELSAGADWRISPRCSTSAMYQFFSESIRTAVSGGKTQQFEVHRGSGSVTVNPFSNLVLLGVFMIENYRLKTPAVGVPADVTAPAAGASPYDYTGDSFSVQLDGTYAFNKKTSCYFRYQHTQALGGSDYAGNNTYDETGVGLKFKPADNQEVDLGYQFRAFDDRTGSGGWDDYDAHSVYLTYALTF